VRREAGMGETRIERCAADPTEFCARKSLTLNLNFSGQIHRSTIAFGSLDLLGA
jgi:hypothetical protein